MEYKELALNIRECFDRLVTLIEKGRIAGLHISSKETITLKPNSYSPESWLDSRYIDLKKVSLEISRTEVF